MAYVNKSFDISGFCSIIKLSMACAMQKNVLEDLQWKNGNAPYAVTFTKDLYRKTLNALSANSQPAFLSKSRKRLPKIHTQVLKQRKISGKLSPENLRHETNIHILLPLQKNRDSNRFPPFSFRRLRMKRNMPNSGSRPWASWVIPQKICFTLPKAKILNGQICTTVWRKKLMKKVSTNWQNSSEALLPLKNPTKNVIALC